MKYSDLRQNFVETEVRFEFIEWKYKSTRNMQIIYDFIQHC